MIRRGVVLAGGASRRMGRDKALIRLPDGRTLVEHAMDRLASMCDDVVVAAGPSRGLTRFDVADGPGKGPVAGILGAAEVAAGEAEILVLACDLPAVPTELLRALTLDDSGADWVVPRWSRGIEPLCALYRPVSLMALRRRAEAGKFSLHDIQYELSTGYLEGSALHHIGRPEEMFLNVNSDRELARWRSSPGEDSMKAGRRGG